MGAVDGAPLQLDVLGTTVVRSADGPMAVRRRERDVLTALALTPGSSLAVSDVADAVWAEAVPPSGAVTIQNHVSRLRRGIGRDVVLTDEVGYRLGPRWSLDIDRRSELVARAASWGRVGQAHRAVEGLDDALALTRGLAFADLGESTLAARARSHHAATTSSIEDDLLLALITAGATARAAIEAGRLVDAEPFREVRWAALAVALYRDGRRRDAVRALRRGQEALRERAGLDVGPTLRRLESLIFDDDPALLTAPPAQLLGRTTTTDERPAPVGRIVDAASAASTGDGFAAAARAAQADLRFADAADAWRLAAECSAMEVGTDAAATIRLRLDEAEALALAGDDRCGTVVNDVLAAAEAAGGDLFGRAASALCRLGPFPSTGPRNQEIADTIERAILAVDTIAARAECHGEAGLFYSLAGDVDLAHHHYERSLEAARATGDPRLVLDALSATYAIVTHPRDQARRSALAAEMLATAERTDDDDGRFSALHLYFAIQVIDADPLVRTTFRHQEALARSLRTAVRRWMAAYQRACLAFLDGRLDDALEVAEDAFATAPVAPARATAAYGMQLLLVRVAQGRGEELAPLVDGAVADEPGLPGWRAVAAWLASLRGDHERVAAECRALHDGLALPPDMTWGGSVVLLARAVAAAGLTEAIGTLTDLLAPYSGQFTWWGAGTVGPFDLALAELAVARGDLASARHHHEVASRAVAALGAVVYQPDLDALAAALGDGPIEG